MEPAIVFDLDGVLVDTEPLKARAHRTALEERGGALSPALYRREMGGPHEEVVRAFLAASDLPVSERAVRRYEATFRAAYREFLSTELEPTRGATELLEACRAEGRPLALVTSSDRWMVEIVLPRLGEETFAAVVTADDVEEAKPAPEPYRRARSAVGASAAAVAVEDTSAGVASAAAAGLSVVAVRHRYNRGHDFPGADDVADSLAPVDAFLARVDRVASRDVRRQRED